MELKIESISIHSWKGIESLNLPLLGRDACLTGRNGACKTSVGDAWLWLWTGQDMAGRSDYEIRPRSEDGEVQHHTEPSVEAVIMLDGQSITLKRTYREIWTRKRGAAEATYTGNTTDYHIDGVPVQAGEYADRLAAIISASDLRLLTDPAAFSTDSSKWGWKERRALLLRVCGDITLQDVVAAHPELKLLESSLPTGRTVEEHRKVLAKRREALNGDLRDLPIRINEAKASITTELPEDPLKSEAEISEEILQLQQGLVRQPSQAMQEYQQSIARLENELSTARHEFTSTTAAQRSVADTNFSTLNRQLNEQIDALAFTRRRVTAATEARDAAIVKRDKLTQEWRTLSADKFTEDASGDTCPTCGRELPIETIQAARDTARAAWNAAHAAALRENEEAGAKVKVAIDSENAALTDYAALEKSTEEQIADLQTKVQEALAAVRAIDELPTPSNITELENQLETARAEEQLDEPADEEAAAREAAQREATNAAIANLESMRGTWATIAATKTANEKAQNRITEHEEQLRTVQREYVLTQEQMDLIERYTVLQAEMLDERVNERFSTISFRLFKTQVNGGIEPCCEALVRTQRGDLVGYQASSTGQQIRAGLEIIGSLAHHMGYFIPVIIDRFESLTPPLPEMRQQILALEHVADVETLTMNI